MSKEKIIVKFDHAEAIHVALIDHKTDKTCIWFFSTEDGITQ